jgi:dTDP-glucose pyrophosphorylase
MWSKYFNHVIQEDQEVNVLKEATTLIPLAGRGSRFAKEGYTDPKPLIPVSGKPMIIQACNSLPKTENYVFVTLEKHLRNYPLEDALTSEYQDCSVVNINEVTEGQAITCSLGLKDVDENQPLLISATDNGMIFNQEKFDQLVNYEEVDAVIFTFRNHVSSKNNPEMYGWVKIDGETATGVSVKVPISEDPFNDHAIVGSFYFKKVEYFNIALENLLKKNVRVNGEYYVDSLMGELIESGYNVKIFEVDDYIGWGTPNDYETFVYWQSYFHKDPNHAYQLEKDPTVNKEELNNLKNKYQAFEQEYR